jgi:MFS family permease
LPSIGSIATVSRWAGIIGIFVFPTLADLYGRKPILVVTILGYSLLTGLTGFSQGPLQLLIFTSIPMFLFVAPETTRKELTDFVGQKT